MMLRHRDITRGATILYVAGEQNSAAARVPRLRRVSSREQRISRGSHDCLSRGTGMSRRYKTFQPGGESGSRAGILCAASAQNGITTALPVGLHYKVCILADTAL